MTGTAFTGFLWIILLEGVLRLYLPDGFETWRFVIYPLILLVMMLLRPEGLFGNYEIPFLRRKMPAQPKKKYESEEDVTTPGPGDAEGLETVTVGGNQ